MQYSSKDKIKMANDQILWRDGSGDLLSYISSAYFNISVLEYKASTSINYIFFLFTY